MTQPTKAPRLSPRLRAFLPLCVVGGLALLGAALVPILRPQSAEPRLVGDADGAFRFQVGKLALEVDGKREPGSMRVEGVAPFLHLGAVVNGKRAELSLGPLRRLPGKRTSVEGDATIRDGERVLSGRVRLLARRAPSGISITYVGEGDAEVRLTMTIREPAALLVPGGAPLLAGSRDAPRVEIVGPGGALSIATTHVTWGERPRWAELVLERQSDLVLGPAVDVSAGAQRRAGIETRRRVVRTSPPLAGAEIVVLDEDGKALATALASATGQVELATPREARRLLVRAGGERIALVDLDASVDLTVATPPMGRLAVDVGDADRPLALPSRIVVHALGGAREPNFGAPTRASGAGPIVDTEDGRFASLLPAGRYRVLATRGPEYTVDQRDVEVRAGGEASAHLLLRHVIDTPGLAGCDLHVHSRGSFDSTVSIEDRVRSLVAQGVDYAAASEHNRVGTYQSAELSGQSRWLTWSRAVEVTTVNPLRGHFNIVPYERDDEVPPFRHTSLGQIIRFARERSPDSLVQVNHPRLGWGIGYFHDVHYDSATQQGLSEVARGFDTLEVYNGFDLPKRDRVEEVLRDWLRLLEAGRTCWATGDSDSHSVQYVTAGYPRTYAMVTDDHENGDGPPVDVRGLVDSLRHGRAFATSGPFVDVTAGALRPGDTLAAEGRIRLHVRIRVAPWIDASELEIYAGGQSVLKNALPDRGLVWGEPLGSLEEARRESIVFDGDVDVEPPPGARAVVVVVRGAKSLGAVLPFMDFQPMAIVNPFLLPKR